MSSGRSIWGGGGEPRPRIEEFLDQLEATGLPKTLSVIGCADGMEVFPAAARGFEVRAIDIDPVALFGGTVQVGQDEVVVNGMRHWLEVDGTLDRVKIIHGDFMVMDDPDEQSTGVLVSGVIHYQDNQKYPLDRVMQKIQSYTAVGGLLLIEYIHPSERNNDPARYFLTQDRMAQYFPSETWRIDSNDTETVIDPPNPRNPQVHEIVWGRLYATKLAAEA